MNRSIACLMLTLGLLVAGPTACRSSSKLKPEMKPAGFLADYTALEVNEKGNFSYIDKTVSLRDYEAFIIEPVVIKFRPDAKADAVPQEVRDKAVRHMKAAITNVVSEHYAIVDEPGVGVVRWRTAITDIRASGDGNGGAGAEIEIVDSVSGKRLVAVVADDTAEGDHTDNPSEWHDAKAVMDIWSARIRAHFDEVHGVKQELMPKR